MEQDNPGGPALVKHHSLDKATTIALEEIAQGKIMCVKKKLEEK